MKLIVIKVKQTYLRAQQRPIHSMLLNLKTEEEVEGPPCDIDKNLMAVFLVHEWEKLCKMNA